MSRMAWPSNKPFYMFRMKMGGGWGVGVWAGSQKGGREEVGRRGGGGSSFPSNSDLFSIPPWPLQCQVSTKEIL